MRCRTCDYALWGIAERRCPECGSGFRPSQFEFRRNLAVFRCPHCAQAYYGTGRRGMLEPREFGCATCGEHVHLDEMILEPAEGVDPDEVEVRYSPWLDLRRRKRRFFGMSRWTSTALMALVSPMQLMRLTPVQSSVGRAVLFSAVTQVIFSLFTVIPFGLLILLAIVVGSGGASAGVQGLVGGAVLYVCSISVTVALTLVWAAMSHLILRMTGGTEHTISRSIHAVCYATPGFVLTAIPCIGGNAAPLSLIWWGCVASLMLQAGYGVRAWRAWVAGIIPPVVLGVVAFGALIWMFVAFGNMQSSWQGYPQNRHGAETLGEAILREANAGEPPRHVASVIADSTWMSTSLLGLDRALDPAAIAVGDLTLADFDRDWSAVTREGRERWEIMLRVAAEEAAAALPEDVIAYRLGIFVFTYPSIPWPPPDGDLWILVESRTLPQGLTSPVLFVAMEADGDIVEFAPADMAVRLAAQNQLRSQHGLPALPDPATVTHERPATAGGDGADAAQP